MDVLDYLDKLDEVEVLFEPIYSADAHMIVAYEVIGEFNYQDKTVNIVELTYDESIPVDIRKELEQTLIKKALTKAEGELNHIQLYLPCNPNLFMLDFGESYINLLKEQVDESRLPHIYLTMRLHKFKGELDQLLHPIKYIKTYGVKIVLDNLGSESKLDQILIMEPTVLKIKVSQLDYNAWGAQSHVFSTIQSLALKMGSMLMFDQIETDYQLYLAWKSGARYFKGSYLQKPSKDFAPKNKLKERFRNECQQFIHTERKLLEAKYEEMKKLQKTISTIVEYAKPDSQNIEKLLELAEKLEDYSFRFYICNEEGFQTSPNIVRKNSRWEADMDKIGKNWSWRPYFLFNMIRMRHNGKGELSSPYNDIETGEMTRTFSMPINNQEYLFVDIIYDYLYEHNILN